MPDTIASAIAILVLDDHALFREGVTRLLSAEPGFEVVSQCGLIEEALATLRHKHVDIVLLDFELQGSDGLQFVRLAKEQGFEGKILVVTAGVEEGIASSLIHAGVAGIFMKDHSAQLLAQGIRDVMSGKVWFDQQLFQAAMAEDVKPNYQQDLPHLTARERQVLSGVFEGMANKEIAAKIGVSESSVKATLQQLFAKTGVRTRGQLVRIALEQYRSQL
ncbi:MAG TPA: response regulator transcription factor [Terriglobales bacterium]|nr:response regulator transcription factor [Terriglobales bacterium]